MSDTEPKGVTTTSDEQVDPAPTCSLFIGGAMDGMRRKVPKELTEVLIAHNERVIEKYRAEQFGTMKKAFRLFLHESIDYGEACEMLLTNYKANGQCPATEQREVGSD